MSKETFNVWFDRLYKIGWDLGKAKELGEVLAAYLNDSQERFRTSSLEEYAYSQNRNLDDYEVHEYKSFFSANIDKDIRERGCRFLLDMQREHGGFDLILALKIVSSGFDTSGEGLAVRLKTNH